MNKFGVVRKLAAVVAGATVAMSAVPAHAASPIPWGERCGVYRLQTDLNRVDVYYKHCNNDPITVRVYYTNGSEGNACFAWASTRRLGSITQIYWAQYVGGYPCNPYA